MKTSKKQRPGLDALRSFPVGLGKSEIEEIRRYHTGPGETIEIRDNKRKKLSGPSVVGKIIDVTIPFKVQKRIFNEYLADSQDSFVSNINSYLENKYPEYTAQQRYDIKCFIITNLTVLGKPIPPDHVHIPIKHGHITWTGEKPPTKEQIEAFEGLADFIFNHPEKIEQMSLRKALKTGHKKTGIPQVCISCGLINSENCNTCQKPYEK